MLPAAYSRAQVHHRHRGRSAAVCTRERKPGHYLPSQPSRAVPFSSFRRHIGHDFSKRLTSSQCVICLSSDTKPRETRECTLHARIYNTFSWCHILMHTRGIPPEWEREEKRERDLQSHFLLADFLKIWSRPSFSEDVKAHPASDFVRF